MFWCTQTCSGALWHVLMHSYMFSCTLICSGALLYVLVHSDRFSCTLTCSRAVEHVLVHSDIFSCTLTYSGALWHHDMFSCTLMLSSELWRISHALFTTQSKNHKVLNSVWGLSFDPPPKKKKNELIGLTLNCSSDVETTTPTTMVMSMEHGQGCCTRSHYQRCRARCSTERRSVEVSLSPATHGSLLPWDESTCCRQAAHSAQLGFLYCSSELLSTSSVINIAVLFVKLLVENQ